ncbi:MAG: hypothetical protein U0359_27750 [Byssovorax sp.]
MAATEPATRPRFQRLTLGGLRSPGLRGVLDEQGEHHPRGTSGESAWISG